MSTTAAGINTTAIRLQRGVCTWLDADIATPPGTKGLARFPHGSGGSRQSPRTKRLVQVVHRSRTYDNLGTPSIGVFGASTGSAALDAAASQPEIAIAVVSRGGWPDPATQLGLVQAPTLLTAGARDTEKARPA